MQEPVLSGSLVLVQPLRARPRERLVRTVDGRTPALSCGWGACLQAGFLGAVCIL